jgi:hypothetical protein
MFGGYRYRAERRLDPYVGMSASPNSELVTDALVMAFQRRRPDRRVVHHSDRGAAYTSLAFSQRVRELELDQSFGSTGDCYDKAAVEAFWATLKRELGWIHNNLAEPCRASQRAVRLHRRLLQPESHSTPARPSKPRRLRTTRRCWSECRNADSPAKTRIHERPQIPVGFDVSRT